MKEKFFRIVFPSFPEISFTVWWLIFSALYCSCFTTIEFLNTPVTGFSGFLVLVSQFAAVVVATSALLGILTINRYAAIVTIPIILLLSAIYGYYRLTLGISLTPMMIEIAMMNDFKTWATVIDPYIIVLAAFVLIISGILTVTRFRYVKSVGKKTGFLLSASFLIIIICSTAIATPLKNCILNRIPFSFYEVGRQYLLTRNEILEHRDAFVDTPASPSDDPPDVIVILGESLRSDHLALNGYHRATTPRLSKENNIISFSDFYSDETFTHRSIPRIMTRADSLNPARGYSEPSFITIFNKAGYRSYWLSNQDNAPSYAYFIHEADTAVYSAAARSLCDYSEWYDSDLLPDIKNFLSEKNEPKLILVHTIGSHWWYKSHYSASEAHFRPEAESRVLAELDKERIINSYDNTVVATDAFLYEIINMIRDRNVILIYVSDHGESLGENGNFLHKGDGEELHQAACIVWWSEEYEQKNPDKIEVLRRSSEKEANTDAIFHTVIDAATISTPVMNRDFSLFSAPDSLQLQ